MNFDRSVCALCSVKRQSFVVEATGNNGLHSAVVPLLHHDWKPFSTAQAAAEKQWNNTSDVVA